MCQSNRSNGIPSYQEKEATTSLNKKRSYQIFTLNVTSASSQDGLTGNGFILLPETTKKKKNTTKQYQTTVFKTLNTWPEKTIVIPEREKTKQTIPMAV